MGVIGRLIKSVEIGTVNEERSFLCLTFSCDDEIRGEIF